MLSLRPVVSPDREPKRELSPGGTSGGLGAFLAGVLMVAAGGYLLLNQVQVTTVLLELRRPGHLRPVAAAAARRHRLPLLRRQVAARLAAHGRRRGHHPGRRADAHGHLLPPDVPLQHAGHARPAVRRRRPGRAVAALVVVAERMLTALVLLVVLRPAPGHLVLARGRPLVFGVLPVGLAWHAGYTLAVSVIMAVLVRRVVAGAPRSGRRRRSVAPPAGSHGA